MSGCVSLILIAVLHAIAGIEFVVNKDFPMAIIMAAFVISDLGFAWIAWKP